MQQNLKITILEELTVNKGKKRTLIDKRKRRKKQSSLVWGDPKIVSNSNLHSNELQRNTSFTTLINFYRKVNKQKFAYMLNRRCSVTWYPIQVHQLVAFHGCTLCCHPQLTRKNDMFLVASFSHHGLWNAILMGNFMITVDCLSFDNNFQLEVEVIWVMASAWHICIQTRNWNLTLTVYNENISVCFATEF